MKTFLQELLIDPATGEKLHYNEAKNLLESDDKSTYEIIDEVPVILPKQPSAAVSALHQNLKSNFNYADHYQKDAVLYNYFEKEKNAATRNEIQRLHEAIINAVPQTAMLILDAGCGNAWLANHFLKKEKKVISMDLSTINATLALKENSNENHAALVADVFHLPLKSNSIDCIVASEIMEHVYEPRLFLDELIEKLKPGGTLIVTTPYNEKIEYYLCVHCNLPTPKNAHLHSFNKQNIKDIIPDNSVKWKAKSFANNFTIKSRINLLLSFLPYRLWQITDRLANKIWGSPTRLIIEIIKK